MADYLDLVVMDINNPDNQCNMLVPLDMELVRFKADTDEAQCLEGKKFQFVLLLLSNI
jgi:hypothetical protein